MSKESREKSMAMAKQLQEAMDLAERYCVNPKGFMKSSSRISPG
jgi:hypothetical protein